MLLIGMVDSFSVVSVRAAGILKQKQPFAISSTFQKSKPTKLFSAAAAIDESEKSISGGGTATIPNEIFNLVKSIVGSGVLGLPAGVAAYGNAPSAVLPAVAMIALIGSFSAYGFSLIGRVCSYTGAVSYPDAWSKSVSEESSSIIAVSTILKTMGAVLTYSMILADTGKALAETAGIMTTRTTSLFGITSLVLLPLCWLKNLSSLAPFSLLGTLGMFYTIIAMAARYFGKAYALPGAKFLVESQFQPSFGSGGAASALHPSAFILICMLSTAYMAHFNAAKFFTELKDNTIKRFNTVVSTSFGISVAIFAAITSLGFLTFGGNSSGLILNNYSAQDSLMSLSRIAVAISLIFSYPLAFQGARDGALELFGIKDRSNKTLNTVTVALLALVTGLAYSLRDVSLVLAFSGAILGNALIYVFPALMLRGSVKKMKDASAALKREAKFAMGVAGLGIGFGAVGLKMAIKSLTG
eukprot:CAMPEP_0178913122 /NCGR_PEP_ID=MMETSP0786-20121207/10661_1 /TAXON_ID=186022 /ORGANISM="Thalassionema frauenfeldii, Strain CCMP 1798" /LENGTH=469 /DNA_ID=CAMNT_0020585817 /DNA_START=182 /DNA_END=1591 /DNA_ORIENTATION=-